ncbi:MAG TPA: prolyl oligopeptidase family serine peptidase, partial [Candidatus Paceibacterota bacterium]|nr:prolyl oligopeptidase family serine peptidase [Candidatus Paceibacterota bacterium]
KVSGAVDYWDLLSEELRIYNFSPSGKKLIYLDDRTGYSTLYLVDLTKEKTNYLPGQQIITKKYSVADFMFWDDDVIYFSANRESSHQWSLYRYNLTTQELLKVADNISYNQQMQKVGPKDNEKLLFTQIINNSTIPTLLDHGTNKLSYFTDIQANPKISGYTEEVVKLDSLSGVLLKPSNYSASAKYPLVIWLHGGPYRQTSLGYHSYFSYGMYDWMLGQIAKSGALVLKLDYRGSYGYGRDFAESITGEVGRGDVSDVLKAQAELKKTYKVTSTYLAGNSYGGYLALRAIADKNAYGRISGALSINGVTDWFVLLDKLENSIFNVQFNGLLEEENSDLYYQANISDHVKNLRGQKIIVAQAEKDSTVPASQADHIAKIFNLKGKALTLVKYKDEDHIFQKKSSLEDLCRQLTSLTSTPADCRWK